MGLADLFRPKYKHSDSEVRADAARQLGADDAEILAEIAREDEDASVRRVAIERLEDPVRLVGVANREPDSRLRELAESRARVRLIEWAEGESEEKAYTAIRRIAELEEGDRALVDVARRAPLAEIRCAAVDNLRADRALADVARSGADPELRVRALGRIGSAEILRAVAVDERRKEVGFAVVDRLEDSESLAHIGSKGKNRSVRARANRKLARENRVAGASSEEKRRHAERVQICRRVEALARTDRWEGAAEAMAEVERDWEALGGSAEAEPDAAERYERASRRFKERYEREGKAALAAMAKASPAASPADADRRGAEPSRAAPAGRARTDEGDAAEGDEGPGAAAEAEEGEPPKSAEESSEKAESPQAKHHREEKAREALDKLKALVEELEAHVGTESIKAGDRALQRAQSRYRNLASLPSSAEAKALVDRYEEARRALLIRLRELREAEEWKRWANVAKKESLIERAEALLRSEEEELLPALKELQAAWKQAGPVPRDKNDVLWSQFKATCDQIYERVKARRAEQAEVEKQNLEKKEALVRRAEELSESTDWERTAEEIKGLQRQWKEIGPVPKKRAGPLWKQFRAACDRFFERRKPQLEKRLAQLRENLEAKQKVVAEIDALAEGAEDWDSAEREMKRLRSEFRKIGPVPRKEMDALGERFRSACDRVFERRKEALAARARELRDELEAAAGRLEARVRGEDPGEGDAAADAAAARAALRELEQARAEGAQEAKARVDAATLRAIESFPEAFQGTDLDPETTLKRMRKLCERAEELVPDAPEAPGADASPEEMAAALKAALAERALGVGRGGDRPVAEVVGELREQWRRLGPTPSSEAEALEARFRAACERAERVAAAGASEQSAAGDRAESQ